MNHKWWSFLLGFVRITIRGSQLEKFINLAGVRGIPLWDLRRNKDNSMSARVRLDGFWSLRHVAKNTHSRIHITGKTGLPFFISRLKRQKVLMAGVISFFLVLYGLSTFIWTVEVKGAENLDSRQVLEIARTYGLSSGAWKPMVHPEKAERAIMQSLTNVEWVGIKIRGTRAQIQIEEKVVVRQPPITGPAHIVANKSGKIYRLMVLKGEGTVKEGAMVEQGQILISGIIQTPPLPGAAPAPGFEQAEPSMPIEKVQAKGEAWAYVWYHGEAEIPLLEEGKEETGNIVTQWRIKWGNQAIIIKGPRDIPFADARYETYVKRLFAWRNIQLPVEIEKVDYHELQAYRIQRNTNQALIEAREKAREMVKSQLPEGVKVLQEMIHPQSGTPDRIKIKVSVETLENIAVTQNITE